MIPNEKGGSGLPLSAMGKQEQMRHEIATTIGCMFDLLGWNTLGPPRYVDLCGQHDYQKLFIKMYVKQCISSFSHKQMLHVITNDCEYHPNTNYGRQV